SGAGSGTDAKAPTFQRAFGGDRGRSCGDLSTNGGFAAAAPGRQRAHHQQQATGGERGLQGDDAGHQVAVAAELAGQHIGRGRGGQGEEQHQDAAFHGRQAEYAGHQEGEGGHGQQAQGAVPGQGGNLAGQFLGAQRGAD